ncbi:MAG TPA: S41 family peptidase [Candidatus Paceibacterota bacterium]
METSRQRFVLAIAIALAIGFGVGVFVSRSSTFLSTPGNQIVTNQDLGKPQEVDFSIFWKTWSLLKEKHVDRESLDYQKMIYGAIKGLVGSINDPYTSFFEPAQSKKFQEEISGTFGGVGIEIGKRNGTLTVISPLKDTPAFRAGVKAGDRILKIDEKTTVDMTTEEAVSLIRGKKGTKVILNITSDGTESKDVTLVRETIKVPTIELAYMQSGNNKVAYLAIFSFNQIVDREFEAAAEEILKSEADSIVLDLRNNPGGLLDSAQYISGWFLDPNQVAVIEEFYDGRKTELRTDGNALLKRYPVIILTNGGSASASEILAGALHDNRKITIVGEKTFGKGSVQQIEELDKGASLKITIAKWLTPAGVSISDKGIEPNIKVELDPKKIEDGTFEVGIQGKDPQLDKALELLR